MSNNNVFNNIVCYWLFGYICICDVVWLFYILCDVIVSCLLIGYMFMYWWLIILYYMLFVRYLSYIVCYV